MNDSLSIWTTIATTKRNATKAQRRALHRWCLFDDRLIRAVTIEEADQLLKIAINTVPNLNLRRLKHLAATSEDKEAARAIQWATAIAAQASGVDMEQLNEDD